MPRRSVKSSLVSKKKRDAAIQQMPSIMRALCLAADAAVQASLGKSFSLIDATRKKQDAEARALEGANRIGGGKNPITATAQYFDASHRMEQVHESAVLHPQQRDTEDPLCRAFIDVIPDHELKAAINFMQRMPHRPSDADLLLRGVYGWRLVLHKWQGYDDAMSLYNLALNLAGSPDKMSKQALQAYLLLQSVYGMANQVVKLVTAFESTCYDRESCANNLSTLTAQLDGIIDLNSDEEAKKVFGEKTVNTLVQYATRLKDQVIVWSGSLEEIIKVIQPLFNQDCNFRRQVESLIKDHRVPTPRQVNALMRQKSIRRALKKVSMPLTEAVDILRYNVKKHLGEKLDSNLFQSNDQLVVSHACRVKRALNFGTEFDGLIAEQRRNLSGHHLQDDNSEGKKVSKDYYTAIYRLKNQLHFYVNTAGRRRISTERLERVNMLNALIDTFLDVNSNVNVKDAEILLSMMQQIQMQHQRDQHWYNRTNRLGDAIREGLQGVKLLDQKGRLSSDVTHKLKAKLDERHVVVSVIRNPFGFRYGMPCGSGANIDNAYRRLLRSRSALASEQSFRGSRAGSTSGSGRQTPSNDLPSVANLEKGGLLGGAGARVAAEEAARVAAEEAARAVAEGKAALPVLGLN